MSFESDLYAALSGAAGNTVLDSGTAQAGSANTLALAADASNVDGAHAGQELTLTAGAGSTQSRTISDYDGVTKIATVSQNWQAQYLSLPGTAGNYGSTPDSAALDITGDIDLRVKLAANDYTPSASQTLLAKDSGAPNRHYIFRIDAAGTLGLLWSADGTSLLTATSGASGVADGTTTWLRATLDVDNGAAGRTARFYKSSDGVTWTQIGSNVTQAGVTSIFSGGGQCEVGSNNGGGNRFAGKIYSAEIRNGIDGTVVASFDAADGKIGDTSLVSSETGETWTLNQAGSPDFAELRPTPDATTEYEVPRLLHAGLIELISERIIPSHEKVQPSAPYVIYTTVFDDKRYDLDGPTTMSKVRLQVDCYADDQDEAMAIADAVIAAIPTSGFPLHRTAHSEQDLGLEPGTQLYRRMLEFSIFHRS